MPERPIIEGSSARLRMHSIHIDNRELMSISGVKDVPSFNDVEIVLLTDVGELRVEGNGLHLTKLNLDDGQVLIEGEIIALQYACDDDRGRGGLFSRMFR